MTDPTLPEDAKLLARLLLAALDELNGLKAARIAYASEFPLTDDGEPDVGNIHANIRKVKADLKAWEAIGVACSGPKPIVWLSGWPKAVTDVCDRIWTADKRADELLTFVRRIRDDRSWRTNDNKLWPDLLSLLDRMPQDGR